MHSLPIPSDGELDILAVLWQRGPSSVREVHEALKKNSAYTTTLKQMQVMNEKGLLVRNERFSTHVYEPAVSKEKTQQQIAENVIRRAFSGSAKNLVLGALTTQSASKEDLAEIRGLLDVLEQRRKSK